MSELRQRFFQSKSKSFLWLGLILTAAVFQYAQIVSFDFLNYDDSIYVVDNKDIKELSVAGLKKIVFYPQYSQELIPPLTSISLAFNYYLDGLSPKGYHLLNLIFHIFNIVFVFLLARLVFQNSNPALFVAAIFAFHPSSVEAIAWVSARKEVQYTFFYLLALLSVFSFWKTRKIHWYIIGLVLFTFSYYSKYAAASFPILYIALALFWKKRQDTGKVLVEGLPFLVFPLYSIYLMILGNAQTLDDNVASTIQETTNVASKYIIQHGDFSMLQKIVLGGYSLMAYIFKFALPFNQQIIYLYPQPDALISFSSKYFLLAIFSLILIVLLSLFMWKKRNSLSAPLTFGILFFLIHIALVLHVLPLGGKVVLADRYTYLPFVGLSIVLLALIKKYLLKKTDYSVSIGLVIFVLVLNIRSYNWIPKWENSATIFTHLTEKEPENLIGHLNLGKYYLDVNQINLADLHLNKAFEIAPDNSMVLLNKGTLHLKRNQPKNALRLFSKALENEPNNHLVYYNIGQAYVQLGKVGPAISAYMTSIDLDKYKSINHLTHLAIGQVYLSEGNASEAMNHFDQSIKHFTNFPQARAGKAKVYLELFYSPNQALNEIMKAFADDPTNPMVLEVYCQILNKQNNHSEMYKISTLFIKHHPQNANAYILRGISNVSIGNAAGCADFEKAILLGSNEAKNHHSKHCGQKM